MTNKHKFFYDEIQDQVIVNFVKGELSKRQSERRQFELAWELNMNFFLGNQYSYISSNNEISDIEKKYYWENREVYNHIAPIVEARLSKLNKINPNFSVLSTELFDNKIHSSTLENKILHSALENNDFKQLIMTACYWSEITGTAFYKLSWQNELGDVVGKKDDTLIKNGDVKISVCSPFEIYPDSNSAEDVQDCDSIIAVRSCPVKFLKEQYGIDVAGSDVDLFEIGNSTFLSGMSGRSNVSKVTHSKKHNHALVVEWYEKPSTANPNGKLTIICEDKLIYDGELPYIIGKNGKRTFPFIKQVSSRQIGCFWGSSIIERCIPIQRAYNAIKNKKHEFIERLAGGVLSVEDGSVDVDNLEEEGLAPGKILIYRNGSTPPKFMEVNQIPQELEGEEEKLLSELNRVSSVSEVMSSSNIPSNINSGSALSMLIGQDNSRLSLTAENVRSSILKVAKYVIRLYRQFANLPRFCTLCDSKGTMQAFYWTKDNIVSEDVFLEAENELDESNLSNREMILSLFEKGVFNDENGEISISNKSRILSMLGIKNYEFESEIDKLQKARAIHENLCIDKLGEPEDIDDHREHIKQHTKFLLTSQDTDLTKEEREKLLLHINSHKAKLEEK